MELLRGENRIYIERDDRTIAELICPLLDANTIKITRVFVDGAWRGRGMAGELMKELVRIAQSKNVRVVSECPYAVHWFEKHPEYQDLLIKEKSVSSGFSCALPQTNGTEGRP